MPTIREYLVSLGAEVDNKSFNKFNAALKSTGMTVAKFGAAMAAVMTMVAKTSISLDKTTQAYEKLATKKKKNIELIRAEQTALKILGKTEKEVKADKALKAQYEALRDIGKAIQLPGVSVGERALRGFLQDFDKLRMVSTYAMNWINHEFLAKIAAPLTQIRKGIQQFTERLQLQLPRLSDKVSQVFSNMFRLAMAGVIALGKLAERFRALPDVVKLVGAALGVAFGISKLGPIALIIAGITTVLALLDDYQTWLRGGNAALGDLWEAMEKGEAFDFLMGKLGDVNEKLKTFAENVQGALKEFFQYGQDAADELIAGLVDHDWKEDGKQIATFFSGLADTLIGFFSGTAADSKGFFASLAEAGGLLVEGLATSVGTAIADFPWGETLTKLISGADNILSVIGGILFGTKDENGNQQYEGLVAHFKNAAKNLVGGLATAVASLGTDEVSAEISRVVDHVFELIGEALSPENIGSLLDSAGNLLLTGSELARKLFTIIGDSFAKIDFMTAGQTIGNAMNTVFEKIIGWLTIASMDLPFTQHTARDNVKKIATGILTFIGSAFHSLKLGDDGVKGVIKGVLDVFTSLLHEGLSDGGEGGLLAEGLDLAKEICVGLVTSILGAFEEVDYAQVGKDIGAAVTRIFSLFTSFFKKSNEQTGILKQIGNIMTGVGTLGLELVKSIAGSIGNVPFNQVSSYISEAVKNLFANFTTFLAGIMEKDETGKTTIEKWGDAFSNLGKGLVGALASAVSGLSLSQVNDAAQLMLHAVFKLISDVFHEIGKEPTETQKAITDGLQGVGTTLGEGLLDFIGSTFDTVSLNAPRVIDGLSKMIGKLFSLIVDIFPSEGSAGSVDILASVGDSAVNMGTAIVNAIAGQLSQVELDKVKDKLVAGVNRLFTLFGQLFSQENVSKAAGAATNFGSRAMDLARSLLSSIGDGFQELKTSDVGETIGSGVSTFIGKISDWIGGQITKNENGESILGMAGTAIYNVADSLVNMIGTAISSLGEGDTLKKLGENLWSFVETSISDLHRRMTDPNALDKIDLTDIGGKIGSAIGGVINLSIDFLGSFVERALEWINGDGQDQLNDIGRQILAGIVAGLGNIYDAIGMAVFGKEGWEKQKQVSDVLKGNSTAVDENGNVISADELAGMAPEEVTAAVQRGAADPYNYAARKKMIDQMFGFVNTGEGEYGEPAETFFGYNTAEKMGLLKRNFFGMLEGKSLADANILNDYSLQLARANTGDDIGAYYTAAANLYAKIQEISGQSPSVEIKVNTADAIAQIDELISKINSVPSVNGADGGNNALGGRFSTATRGVFGEDGTEYIIPITKPGRAKALILQMFNEMGAGAASILAELGVGSGGGMGMGGPGMGWSSQPAAMYPQAGGNVKSNSDNSVNVPTTINVYGSGDALAAGQAAARASQSNVLRSVRGVLGA